MKKCSWWRGHCIHFIESTTRRVDITGERDCAFAKYSSDVCGTYIAITRVGECCRCEYSKTFRLKDYDIFRAERYPKEGEE